MVLVPSGCTFPYEPGMAGQEFSLVYIWPPNTSELNSLDYYIWNIIKGKINQCFHNTKDSLKITIMDVMANMNENHMIQAFSCFS